MTGKLSDFEVIAGAGAGAKKLPSGSMQLGDVAARIRLEVDPTHLRVLAAAGTVDAKYTHSMCT